MYMYMYVYIYIYEYAYEYIYEYIYIVYGLRYEEEDASVAVMQAGHHYIDIRAPADEATLQISLVAYFKVVAAIGQCRVQGVGLRVVGCGFRLRTSKSWPQLHQWLAQSSPGCGCAFGV